MYNPGQEISSIDFGAIIGGSLNAVVKAQSQSAQTTVDFIKNVGFQKKLTKDEEGNSIEMDEPINVAFSYDKEVSPSQVLAHPHYSVMIDAEYAGEGYQSSEAGDYKLLAGTNELSLKKLTLESGKVTGIELGEIPDGLDITDGTKLTLNYIGSDDSLKPSKAAELTLKVENSYENVPAVTQKMQIQVPILTMMPIPFIKVEQADIEFNVKINSVSTTSSDSKTDFSTKADVRSGWFVKANLSAAFSNQKATSSKEEVKKDYSLNIKVHATQDDMPSGVSRILDMLEDTIKAQPVSMPSGAGASAAVA